MTGFVGRLRFEALHLVPAVHRQQHLAGLLAVVVADDAVLGHVIDQLRRPAVADAQAPLQ